MTCYLEFVRESYYNPPRRKYTFGVMHCHAMPCHLSYYCYYVLSITHYINVLTLVKWILATPLQMKHTEGVQVLHPQVRRLFVARPGIRGGGELTEEPCWWTCLVKVGPAAKLTTQLVLHHL